MRLRAGIILIQDDHLALIKRVKQGRLYYVLPGGGVQEGEFSEMAARREALEELGVEVAITRLLFINETLNSKFGNCQLYYLAERVTGAFGTGTGEEFSRSDDHGLYQAVWLPLSELSSYEVYPKGVADYLSTHGIPKEIRQFHERI